jgi:hypothetical protein
MTEESYKGKSNNFVGVSVGWFKFFFLVYNGAEDLNFFGFFFLVGSDSINDGFKRRLMSHLREKGFDVGECQLHATIIVLALIKYLL